MKTCRYCGTGNLHWHTTVSLAGGPTRYQLVDSQEQRHSCELSRIYYHPQVLDVDKYIIDQYIAAHGPTTNVRLVFPNGYIGPTLAVPLNYSSTQRAGATDTVLRRPRQPEQPLPLLPMPQPIVINMGDGVEGRNEMISSIRRSGERLSNLLNNNRGVESNSTMTLERAASDTAPVTDEEKQFMMSKDMPIMFRFRGLWERTVSYLKNDVVAHDKAFWIADEVSLGINPSEINVADQFWSYCTKQEFKDIVDLITFKISTGNTTVSSGTSPIKVGERAIKL